MADDIILTPSARNTLVAIQRVNTLINRTSLRISSGQKATALENPGAFFDASALTSRAAGFLRIKDNVNIAASTLQAAVDTIASIDSLLDSAKSLAQQAKSESDANAALLAIQFDVIRGQIDDLVTDSSFNSVNLLKSSPDTLTVTFNENGSSELVVAGIASDITTLAVLSGVTNYNNFVADSDSDNAITAIDAAIVTLRQTSLSLGTKDTIIDARVTFTDGLIASLEGGAAKLINTDLETEAANLLALQTQRSLAISTLSLLDSTATGSSLLALL
jgi:flagellin-like hook-associated protein FlgL